jgi:hypothetical protein
MTGLTLGTGNAPSFFQVYLKRTSATPDLGYNQNDIINLGASGMADHQGVGTRNWGVWFTSSTLNLQSGSATSWLYITQKTGGTQGQADTTGWQFIFKVWK